MLNKLESNSKMKKGEKLALYSIIRLYQRLIASRKISHNGSGFRRMMQLNDRLYQ